MDAETQCRCSSSRQRSTGCGESDGAPHSLTLNHRRLGWWCSSPPPSASSVTAGAVSSGRRMPFVRTKRSSCGDCPNTGGGIDDGKTATTASAKRRRVCMVLMAAAGVAFALGVLVGFTLHLYMPTSVRSLRAMRGITDDGNDVRTPPQPNVDANTIGTWVMLIHDKENNVGGGGGVASLNGAAVASAQISELANNLDSPGRDEPSGFRRNTGPNRGRPVFSLTDLVQARRQTVGMRASIGNNNHGLAKGRHRQAAVVPMPTLIPKIAPSVTRSLSSPLADPAPSSELTPTDDDSDVPPTPAPRPHPPRKTVIATPPQSSSSTSPKPSSSQHANISHLVSGVYWTQPVEDLLPIGFGDVEASEWRLFARRTPIVRLANGCGRMQNRMLIFENGSRSCGRYRQNGDQIQGEVFSALLAHLLGLRNLPPAVLALPGGGGGQRRHPDGGHGDEQWRRVHGQLALAQWREDRPLVLTQFIDGLEPAFIPPQLRGSDRHFHPIPEDLANVSESRVVELVQWTDLIVFDYLTANLDRVVNNLYNKQWNPDMMTAPAHNLARRPDTGLLMFLDNESGLLHGYRLLDKYESYHRALLDALCVFREPTARAIRRLHRDGNVGELLKKALRNAEPDLTDWLQPLPERNVKILMERIAHVHKRIRECETLYGPS